MARGDHIFVKRLGYTHHGVDLGDGVAIHFCGEPGSKANATIRLCTYDEFLAGGVMQVVAYATRLDVEVTVARAESKVGESGYRLYSNNCEHFARWCVTGRHSSAQVNGARTIGGVAGISGSAAAGGIGIVAAVGEVAGLSGSGIMSGLAATGVAGSGAVGGLVTLGVAPAALSAGAMQLALRDDECLPEPEREARKVGRRASVAGAAVGTGAGVAAVSSAGAVSGLSAAGITSGLAAIGTGVGGGMAAGSAVVIAAPAVAAAGVGYGMYRLARLIHGRLGVG